MDSIIIILIIIIMVILSAILSGELIAKNVPLSVLPTALIVDVSRLKQYR